jgi:hypothetical protein
VAIVSTIRLNNTEKWWDFEPEQNKQARILAFMGHSLILNGDVPK